MDLQNDHDILISVDGKLDNLIASMNNMSAFTKGLEGRIMALEIGRASDTAEQKQLIDDVRVLKTNNSIWATLNSVGIVLAAVIGWKF